MLVETGHKTLDEMEQIMIAERAEVFYLLERSMEALASSLGISRATLYRKLKKYKKQTFKLDYKGEEAFPHGS